MLKKVVFLYGIKKKKFKKLKKKKKLANHKYMFKCYCCVCVVELYKYGVSGNLKEKREFN